MDKHYERVAGLDVHKKSVVATRMRVTSEKAGGVGDADVWHHNAGVVRVARLVS